MKSSSLSPRRFALAALVALATAGAAHAAGPAPRGIECLIEPWQSVEVRSPVEGLIEKVLVDRGDTVRKGQALVELESDVERSSLQVAKFRAEMAGRVASARNRVEFSTRKLQRAQELLADSFVSTQARDEAQTEKLLAESELADALENQALAKLELQRAGDQLRQRTLKAPFDGYVVDRYLHPGDLAEAGAGRKAVLKLAQLNPLRVELVLPQQLHGRIAVGSTVQVTPDGFGGRAAARVTVVDRVIDAASGTFGVRLELPNPKGTVPSGVRCAVEAPGLALPKAPPAAGPAGVAPVSR